MKRYDINSENIRDYMSNSGFDFPLKIDDKAGLDFKDEKTKAILADTCLFEKKSKTRAVKLEITSFRGISWGAIHYYGKMIADGIEFQMLNNPNCATSNFKARKLNPLYQWSYEFDLRRPTTLEEINSDPDRWECCAAGDFTSSFETKEEIIALAKQCFKIRFAGNWELWIDDRTLARESFYKIDQLYNQKTT